MSWTVSTTTELRVDHAHKTRFPFVGPHQELLDSRSTDSHLGQGSFQEYWTQLQGRSDEMSSPVYQSPIPEEHPHRQYYELNEPALQGLVHQGAHHSVPDTCSTMGRGGLSPPSEGSRSVYEHTESFHGCGGHCIAFQNFCYYTLQISFVIGILAGVSLCIAGGVLRRSHRGGDLLVLVYIGALVAMVSTLLLGVQCCVRRKVKARKRALARPRTIVRSSDGNAWNAGAGQHIPMNTIDRNLGPSRVCQQIPAQQQLRPLLARLVEQQSQDANGPSRSHPHFKSHHRYARDHSAYAGSGNTQTKLHDNRATVRSLKSKQNVEPYSSVRLPLEDHNGVPWWRQAELRLELEN